MAFVRRGPRDATKRVRVQSGNRHRAANGPKDFGDAIRIDRKLNSTDVIDVPTDLFVLHCVPENIRSDDGPEFISKAVSQWIGAVGANTA